MVEYTSYKKYVECTGWPKNIRQVKITSTIILIHTICDKPSKGLHSLDKFYITMRILDLGIVELHS